MCDVVAAECCISEDGEPPSKRPAASIRIGSGFKWNLQALTMAADAVESGGKSPVSALNELGVRVSYSLLRQGGPAHCPIFTVALHVADMTFEGWGHSKREARAAAARSCLAALLARAGRVLPSQQNQIMDFTSDLTDKITVSEFQCLEANSNTAIKSTEENANPDSPSMTPSTALFGGLPVAQSFSKSPINLLYENYPGLTFVCTFGDGSPLNGPQGNIAPLQLSHSMRFKVVCHIKEQIFEGYGSSKKLAKLAAARAALAQLSEGRSDCSPAGDGALPQTLADHVSKLVNEKFNELMKDDLNHSKRKVLAGIVLTVDNRTEGAKVIAITTGTKCVSGEHMSVRGRAVNDCHAEVAARRCLQRYIYAQLLRYASQPNPLAVIPDADIEPAPGGGYQMKANRHLHLYVSTAPCGDGRIFSPHEPNEPAPDKHPNRQARGQLRTKIESGEGTIPVKNCTNVLQTWDGVMQGERLLTMSCSDKVARWCVVGLQGALLSRLIRPVYLHSLVLGSLLHPHHMYRALCGRIEGYISSLPPPFKLHKPILARAASTEARTPARAPSFSVCWSVTAPMPEVLNAMTGKLESGQPSLLCKQSMFARWQYLMQRLAPVKDELAVSRPHARIDDSLLYAEAKQQCPAYQEAKSRLFEAFERAKLGKWIKKPLEQDQFVCELSNADPRFLFAWAGDGLRGYNSMQHVLNDMVRELGRRKAASLCRNDVEVNGDGVVTNQGGNDQSVVGSSDDRVDSGSGVVKPGGVVWKLTGSCNAKDSGADGDKETLYSDRDDLGKVGQNLVVNEGIKHFEVENTEGVVKNKDISDKKAIKGEHNHSVMGIADVTKGILGGDKAKMCQNVFSVVTDQSTGFDEYDNVTTVEIKNVVVKDRNVAGRVSDISRNIQGIYLQGGSDDINETIPKNSKRIVQYDDITKSNQVTSNSSINENEWKITSDKEVETKKEPDDTKAEKNRKYLNLVKKRSVSFHDVDDLTVFVDRGCRNVSTKNVTTVYRNDAYGTKSITNESKDNRSTSFITDRDFKYRYIVETENFWNPERHNPTYYQKCDVTSIASINIDSNAKLNNIDKSKDSDNQTVNDLINNLKDCNIHNDRKKCKESQKHHKHPNDTDKNQDPNSDDNSNKRPNSTLFNRLQMRSPQVSEVDNSKVSYTKNNEIFHRNNVKDFYSKQVFKSKTTVRNEEPIKRDNDIDLDRPQTSKGGGDFGKGMPTAIVHTRDPQNERFKIDDVNKENKTNNVKENDHRVVNTDDGKHIRSAVLLRKLECKKT